MERDKYLVQERRKYPRAKESIFILYHLTTDSSEKFKAIVQNISGGGLMFESDREIPVQSELGLEIYQPVGHGKKIIFSIPASGEVVWIRKIEKKTFREGENKYRIGLEFSEIKGEDRQRIVKYVNLMNALERK